MNSRVLLLMPSTTYRAADFLEAAHRLQVKVTVGCEQRQSLEDRVPGSTLTLDFQDVGAATEKIKTFARAHPLRAVVGVEDETTLLAAQAACALGLGHNPIDSVRATRNKHRLRKIFKANGLPTPSFREVKVAEDSTILAEEIAYPCVVKPLFLSASRGVMRADDPESFVSAFRRLSAILARPEVAVRGGEEADRILVESYIPGEEVALEGLLDGGRLKVLALFDKPDPLEGPTFEETIYVTPSRRSDSVQRNIVQTVSRATRALGLREGPVHAEVRINDEGVWPLEVAARSIGGLCARSLRFGTGLSLEDLILHHALGREVESLEREKCPAGVMMIPVPRAGILREVRGLARARSLPGIEEVTQSIAVGQTVEPLPEGNRYLGFIFARAESPSAVEAALREAHRALEIVISSPEALSS